MHEEEWLKSNDLQAMLEIIRNEPIPRKDRLCAVAWARSVLRHATTEPAFQPYRDWLDEASWTPQLEAAERFADGMISPATLRAARRPSGGPYNFFMIVAGVSRFSLGEAFTALRGIKGEFKLPHLEEICGLIREVFGNPLRLVTFEPCWRSGNAVALAHTMYDERDFAAMPILADALQDAGCEVPAILDHCRSPGPHVRGCWVVDLVLGKQ
jgi:hypothetical protein